MCMILYLFFFFFSSRRRHTRYWRDWSSDVCSSDLVYLTAVLSVSIGLFNLFPIPMLDGGHLVFYAIEGLRGRPLSPRVQDLGFRIGFALVIMLFIFVTFNDIVNLS